jgi:sulfur carrier protein
MKIWVNQKEHQTTTAISLLSLLTELQKADKTGIAVALNNRVVPKVEWKNYTLQSEDKVTIITATQGG